MALFSRDDFLDTPWKLEACDPAIILDLFSPPKAQGEEAHLDIGQDQRIRLEFIADLHQQLQLNMQERGWTPPALIHWLDRRIPLKARQDITPVSSRLYIMKTLEVIQDRLGLSFEAVAKAKFRLVEALIKAIAKHRQDREGNAFQHALFAQSGLEFATSSDLALVFDEARYAYNEPYKGGTVLPKHCFRVIGDLGSVDKGFDPDFDSG